MSVPGLFMSSCRAFPVVVRAIHRYKDKYPTLFADLKESQRTGYWDTYWAIKLSDQGQTEYLTMVENDLAVKKVPNSNRKVWITTHTGGQFVGFYEDGKWQYHTVDEKAIIVDSIVIKWDSYETGNRLFSGIKKFGNKKKREAYINREVLKTS